MPRLILSMDGLVLKEMPLEKERTTIGRKPHNDIQIDNLAISGEHAAIVTILNDAFLEDLNSTNGTYVNGQPVKKHVLQNNDVVELGSTVSSSLRSSTGAPSMTRRCPWCRPCR
jgi:pSer/pThr/pTyr-binding forkhead associated (FHA) protein